MVEEDVVYGSDNKVNNKKKKKKKGQKKKGEFVLYDGFIVSVQ
jgi:hypothetical protein